MFVCESCKPEHVRVVDVTENPFAQCAVCGDSADDVGGILEVELVVV